MSASTPNLVYSASDPAYIQNLRASAEKVKMYNFRAIPSKTKQDLVKYLKFSNYSTVVDLWLIQGHPKSNFQLLIDTTDGPTMLENMATWYGESEVGSKKEQDCAKLLINWTAAPNCIKTLSENLLPNDEKRLVEILYAILLPSVKKLQVARFQALYEAIWTFAPEEQRKQACRKLHSELTFLHKDGIDKEGYLFLAPFSSPLFFLGGAGEEAKE